MPCCVQSPRVCGLLTAWLRSLERLAEAKAESLCILTSQCWSVSGQLPGVQEETPGLWLWHWLLGRRLSLQQQVLSQVAAAQNGYLGTGHRVLEEQDTALESQPYLGTQDSLDCQL